MATGRTVSPAPWTGSAVRPRVVLLGAGDRPRVCDEALRLRRRISELADVVLEDFAWQADLSSVSSDLVVVLGGDGSILRAAKQMGLHQVPVIGVNLGKLGFLADLSPEAFIAGFADICAGRCRVVEHLMFHCELFHEDGCVARELGLNEAAIFAGPPFSLVQIDLYVDADFATSYSCDGLIISTPVGSTAHSLSAGGPILRKDLEAFVISPISPHTLTVRPVVESANRVYEMVICKPNDTTTLVVDGRAIGVVTAHHRVRVQRAVPTFKLVELQGHSYYDTLREKLGWGGAIRR